jgi:hypothetical protein
MGTPGRVTRNGSLFHSLAREDWTNHKSSRNLRFAVLSFLLWSGVIMGNNADAASSSSHKEQVVTESMSVEATLELPIPTVTTMAEDAAEEEEAPGTVGTTTTASSQSSDGSEGETPGCEKIISADTDGQQLEDDTTGQQHSWEESIHAPAVAAVVAGQATTKNTTENLTSLLVPVEQLGQQLTVASLPSNTSQDDDDDDDCDDDDDPIMLLDDDEASIVSAEVYQTPINGGGSVASPIEDIERNLANIIRRHGGSMDQALWRERYIVEYGEQAFHAHMAAANCTKLKTLLAKMKTITKGTGPKTKEVLYYRPPPGSSASSASQQATLSPEAKALLEIENNLLLLIQGRKGKLLESKASSDYRQAYGPRSMEFCLKTCHCNSLKSAVKKMVRIKVVKENKHVYYVLSNPSQAITLPPSSQKAKQVNKKTTVYVPTPAITTPIPPVQKYVPQQSRPVVEQTKQQPATTGGGGPLAAAGAYIMIDSLDKLDDWNDNFLKPYLVTSPYNKDTESKRRNAVAISCKGVPNSLDIIAMAFAMKDGTFVFDLVKLDVKAASECWRPLFATTSVCKLFHDLHADVAALSHFGGIDTFAGLMDTQLMAEYMHQDLHCDYHEMLDCLDIAIPAAMRLKQKYMPKAELFARRPISVDVITPVIDMVQVLVTSYGTIQDRFDDKTWTALLEASNMRAAASTKGGASRRIGFDVTRGYAMASYELLYSVHPQNMMNEQPLEVVQDITTLLKILPADLEDALSALDSTHLSDIVLDKGRRPHAWVANERTMLLTPDRFVDQDEIEDIAKRFRFGSDNRAGLERQLHRISALRNRETNVIGMTIRVGRHVSGNAGIIADLLFNKLKSSILFLGEPGSGK